VRLVLRDFETGRGLMVVKKAKPVSAYYSAARRYLWLRGNFTPSKKEVREEAAAVRRQLIKMGFARE